MNIYAVGCFKKKITPGQFNASNLVLIVVRVCLLFAFVFFTNPVGSQILNIDKSDTAVYSSITKVSFNFSTGLEINKQKDILYDATNSAELLLQKNRELYLFSGSYRFTYNGPQDFLNAGFVHLRFRHNYKDKVAPETYLQYQWDNKRGLLRRALTGANIRYNFWKRDALEFNAAIGVMYEEEKWNYAAVDSQKIPAVAAQVIRQLIKLNSYVRIDWKAGTHSDLAATVFLQTRPGAFKPRIAPLIQWNIEAGKHVGFIIGFNSLYDVAPVVPISHFYYDFSQSILLKW